MLKYNNACRLPFFIHTKDIKFSPNIYIKNEYTASLFRQRYKESLNLRCSSRCSRRRSRHGFIFLPRGRQACPIRGDEIPFPQTAKGLVAEDVGIGVEVGEEDVH